jgi:queuine tRNA-ribosyltransferase
VGGLSVGEERSVLMEMLAASIAELPGDRPRYFMGLGKPGDILDAVRMGVDMFDCVLPTRSGRTGLLFTRNGELVIKQAGYRLDDRPIDPECACPVCRTFSRAYLRHLFVSREMLGPVLNTIHNLHFYQWLMARIRESIQAGTFVTLYDGLAATVRRRMEPGEP